MAEPKIHMESKQETRSHPKLPEFLERGTIGEMYPGDSVAARCIALRATKDGRVWLDPQLETHDDLSPEHPLLIWRTEEGFGVDVTLTVKEAPYRWPLDQDLADISSKYDVEEGEWIIPKYFLPRIPRQRI